MLIVKQFSIKDDFQDYFNEKFQRKESEMVILKFLIKYWLKIEKKRKRMEKERERRKEFGNEFSRFSGDGNADLFRMIENYLMRMDSKRGRETNLFVQDQCLIGHTFITRTRHMAFYNYRLD